PVNAASILSRLLTASERWQNPSSAKQRQRNPRWPRCQLADTQSWTKCDGRSKDGPVRCSRSCKSSEAIQSRDPLGAARKLRRRRLSFYNNLDSRGGDRGAVGRPICFPGSRFGKRFQSNELYFST